MKVKGFEKTSLIDFRSNITSVVFVGGCSMRCGFCYNPDLVMSPDELPDISDEEIFGYLESQQGFIDGVCITGGEPCMQAGFEEFCARVKDCGLLVKVNTNGLHPDVLTRLLDRKLVDYIAMDVKAPAAKYSEIAGVEVDAEIVRESIGIIMKIGVDYAFHTTPVPGLVGMEEIREIARDLIPGARLLALNSFRSDRSLMDKTLENRDVFTNEELQEIKSAAEEYIKEVEVL